MVKLERKCTQTKRRTALGMLPRIQRTRQTSSCALRTPFFFLVLFFAHDPQKGRLVFRINFLLGLSFISYCSTSFWLRAARRRLGLLVFLFFVRTAAAVAAFIHV